MGLLLDFSYGKLLFLRYSIVMRRLSGVAGLGDWKTDASSPRVPPVLPSPNPGWLKKSGLANPNAAEPQRFLRPRSRFVKIPPVRPPPGWSVAKHQTS